MSALLQRSFTVPIGLIFLVVPLLCLSVCWTWYQFYCLKAKLKQELQAQSSVEEKDLQAMIRHQFRPHFLFNCLNMVSFFIYSNPKQAEAALIHFSNYLRLHLAALNQPEEIPFQIELEHVKAYLSLEQLRFGNKLSVIYNIGCSQFSLSCLCLLSIVENAVRHGLENKDSGGTVIISTYETHSAYVIKVTDDGLGFDPASPPAEDGKPHVGIQTVRQKLEAPGKGMLKIDSRPGMGTAVSILVFKEKVNDHLSG